jgi:hypothetical protein
MNFAAASPPLVDFLNTPDGTEIVPLFRLLKKPAIQKVNFATWWAKECVYWDHGGAGELTRRQLTLAVSSQDDGELVDTRVRRKSGGGWLGSAGSGAPQSLETAIATMRQIAWEVTETLKYVGEIA